MQETDFIQQNKDKWKEFEDVLKSTDKDPERLTDLFIETTDDLSYSRTYYPNRSVRVYLNGISQLVYQAIYKNKSREKNIFRKFWMEDLPDAMWHSRKALLFSVLIFVTGTLIGVISSIYYPEFARIILGDYYVEMTNSNIENGDPMAVYKNSEPFEMFFRIAWNNIRIAFGTFVLGILFGVGTVYVILSNAIMFGTFMYFFIERGLFRESFLAVMLHGTLELSMIAVAGCAGFALARGLIFPGTYTRGAALIHSARNGIKILCGVTILLIYAAIIESFATRYTEMPDIIRLLIILLSATIVVGYFVWYPRIRYKRGLINKNSEETAMSVEHIFDLKIIKSAGKIFTEVFVLFSRNIRLIAILSITSALIITAAFAFFTNWQMHEIETIKFYRYADRIFFDPWLIYNDHLDFERFPLILPLIIFLFSIFAIALFRKFHKNIGSATLQGWANQSISIFFISLVAALPMLLPHVATYFIYPFYLPFCLLWMYVTIYNNQFFLSSIIPTFKLVSGNFMRLTGTYLSTLVVQWIGTFILFSVINMFLVDFIVFNIPAHVENSEQAKMIISTIFLFFIQGFNLSMPIAGTVLVFYSLKEINEANSLHQAIEKIGFRKRAYGLEKEG